MPEIVEWGDIGKNDTKKPTGDIRNLRLKSGETYEVRFVGTPLEFYRYFQNGKYAICEHPEENPVKKTFGLEPAKRFAINVLLRATLVGDDRKDDGQVYMLDAAPSIIKPVVAWAKLRKTDPGGKNGVNFAITVTGQKEKTRYEVTPLDSAQFTEEEKDYLRSNAYDLTKFFKPVPNSELVEKLGMSGAAKPAQAQAQAQTSQDTRAKDLPF